ncbi:MAG: DUF1890 domain-containing protein [Methanothrix sp.]|jgi:hypothetical protein|uniref:DUF1890 domain-containing protein n=1 Tax=Methanothrix harundinacea TaxID=301375 RepID=A0A117LG80_9EURY|nr:MAG: hypothetical protein APR56_12850 [Methanosaeta sp. SDB]KUK45488.1 MAG: Uncharacterized protein XD72_0131 [Methanothrix harundinacea]MDD2638403.1 DUF1890 domain-containing protein [Methanothrix sp.]MDI9399326.1 DUF1890 domain-containing protein [Euryarchaeota archaeon]KUK97059.1 MAG: Uncharacterized protein XE07_0630 [Methanothrix harundinacea]
MEGSESSGDAAALINSGKRRVLLLLGCPEVPVQTSIALYLAHNLRRRGDEVVVAGTGAALKLMKLADPMGHYIGETMNIDRCIASISEGKMDFELCFAFAHSDAGISYAGTMSYISGAELFLLIFGRGAEELEKTVDFDCRKLVAKAVHDPVPLKRLIDEVID